MFLAQQENLLVPDHWTELFLSPATHLYKCLDDPVTHLNPYKTLLGIFHNAVPQYCAGNWCRFQGPKCHCICKTNHGYYTDTLNQTKTNTIIQKIIKCNKQTEVQYFLNIIIILKILNKYWVWKRKLETTPTRGNQDKLWLVYLNLLPLPCRRT